MHELQCCFYGPNSLVSYFHFLFQNSFTHIQAISDALEESFATIDFGPELSSDDDLALKNPSRHRRGSAPVDTNQSVLTEEITTTKSHPVVPELSAQLLPEPIVSVSDPEFAFNEEDKSAESSSSRKNLSNENESEKLQPLFERVTSVDESVTPIIENNDSNELNLEIIPLLPGEKSLTLTDWSMRSLIPEPPSGFQDSIVTDNTINMIPDPLDTNNIVMDKVPTITGPMKFSINSYNERTVKENSYNPVKLSRTESTREAENNNNSQINLNKSSPTMPTLTKSESFGFARFNGNSTLAGNQSLSNLLIISVFY